MKIAVFGATGKTGTQVVRQALSQGHEVKAFVRDPAKMLVQHDRLTLVQGDVLDPQAVDGAIAGAEAVIITLGGKPDTKATVLTEGTTHIVSAMKKHGVARLIVMSSYPMSGSPESLAFLAGTPPNTMKMLQLAIDDKLAQEKVARESGLDWTIVRPLILTDGGKTGRYRVGETLAIKKTDTISRADVADFLLTLLTSGEWVRKIVTVSF